MRADDETYERALLMRGVDADDALARARAAGVRASRAAVRRVARGRGRRALAHEAAARERRLRARVGAVERARSRASRAPVVSL